MFDVIVVGGGVIGAAVAYYLSLEKLKVLVLEKDSVGQHASAGAVGFLTVDSVPFSHDVLREAGLYSRKAYLSLAPQFKKECGVDIDLETCGTLRVAKNEFDLANLRQEGDWQKAHIGEGGTDFKTVPAPMARPNRTFSLKKCGDVDFLTATEIAKRWPAIEGKIAGGFFYPQDIQVTSSRIIEAFRQSAAALGADFQESREVTSWETNGRRIMAVTAGGKKYAALTFVLAAGPWSEALAKPLGLRVPVYPVRGQLLIFEMAQRFLSCPIITGGAARASGPISALEALRSGAAESYYLGPKPDGHLYAGTTLEEAGFDESCTEEALERIGNEVCRIVPKAGELPVKGSWAGLRPATKDNLPILGKAPELDNLYLATGHFRKGILLAPFTGKAIADLIVGRKPMLPLDDFSPARF
ncbi:MAG: FAD-dependent oxidoreductase [Elusimicrobia bacterium]|nr:FAD-dependent oxidoreductase [Elusimicrobiota bacterium]